MMPRPSFIRPGIIIRGYPQLGGLLVFFGLFALFAGGWSTALGFLLIICGALLAIVFWEKYS